jgi:uncharacterized protein
MFLAMLFICTVVAFTISAVSGGGAGLVLMPVLRAGLPMAQVPVALSLGSAASSLMRMGVFVRHIDWRIVRWFVPASLPGALLGTWLLRHASPAYAELVIGLFLMGNLPMLWRKPRVVAASRPATHGTLAVIGFLAGGISGFTGAVGLLFNGFYLRYGLSRERLVATRAANEIVLHLVKLVLYACFGLMTREALVAGAVLGAAAIVAAFVSRQVIPRLGEALFRRAGYAAMIVAGVAMLDGSTADLAQRHGVTVHASRVAGGFDAQVRGFGREATLEFRRTEAMEVEYAVAIADLPNHVRTQVEQLAEGADRVMVEAVHTLTRRAFEVYVWRGDVMEKHTL